MWGDNRQSSVLWFPRIITKPLFSFHHNNCLLLLWSTPTSTVVEIRSCRLLTADFDHRILCTRSQTSEFLLLLRIWLLLLTETLAPSAFLDQDELIQYADSFTWSRYRVQLLSKIAVPTKFSNHGGISNRY